MTVEEEQELIEIISNETTKLKNLTETHKIEVKQKKKQPIRRVSADQQRADLDRAEKIAFDLLCKREAEEKRYLLQAVIKEAEESGFPMPPSLVKLLNHTYGN